MVSAAISTTLNATQLEAGMGVLGPFWLDSSADNITAFSGGGKANATKINSQISRITTVAAAGDSIVLPPAIPGLDLMVINHGVNNMAVFGQGTDTIDDNTAAAGTIQMFNSFVFYACITAGLWYTEGLASGFVSGGGSFQTYSTQNVASTAGGTQGTSVLCTAMQVQITGPASGATGILLPPAKAGMELTIMNNSTNATPFTMFASGSDTINGTAGATGIAGPANAAPPTLLYCFTAGAWVSK